VIGYEFAAQTLEMTLRVKEIASLTLAMTVRAGI